MKPERILLESTCTFGAGFTTGVQRVVRSIVREAQDLQQQTGLQCVPVVLRNGRFYSASQAWTQKTRRRTPRDWSPVSHVKTTIGRVSPRAARYYAKVFTRLKKTFYPNTFARVLTDFYWRANGQEVCFRDTDVLVLLDESWNLPIWPAVREAKTRGCPIGAVLYDLIPLEYPHFFREGFSARFNGWLDDVIDHADFLLAISETVRDKLEAYLRSSRRSQGDLRKPVRSFRLGSDISGGPANGYVRPDLRRVFETDRNRVPYLIVSTIEPRKNHTYLLDAFDAVWNRCPHASLCIVGRIGWKCRDVLERITSHPRFGNSLYMFNDLSDSEVRFCYEHAKTLIVPSIAEGFGLPIVEGLRYGLRVLASDIPIHREVGRHHCTYFDLRSPESLTKLVIDSQKHGASPSAPDSAGSDTLSWTESCLELLTKITDGT